MYSSHMRPPPFVLFEDTHPEAEAALIALYRQMSPEKKLRQVGALNRTVKQLALSRLRQDDPEASDEVLKLRLAALWLDPALLLAAYGQERLKAAGLL